MFSSFRNPQTLSRNPKLINEDAASDNEDPEVEECRVCFRSGGRVVMIECDECLGGFHFKCLKPPLKEVPEGNWICGFCEAKKSRKVG